MSEAEDEEARLLRERLCATSTAELTAISASNDYTEMARGLAGSIVAARAAQPPTQPCDAHPSMQVVSTCTRCGAFICVDCDAFFSRGASGQCVSCQARGRSSPIARTFLRPVVVGVSVTGVGALVDAAATLLASEHLHPFARVALVVGQFTLGAMSVAGATQLARRHASARRWLTGACLLGVALLAGSIRLGLAHGMGCGLTFLLVSTLYVNLSRGVQRALSAVAEPREPT